MDRRTLLALLLTAIVIVVTPILFPSSRARPPVTGDTIVTAIDTARPAAPIAAPIGAPAAAAAAPPTASVPAAAPSRTPQSAPARIVRAETTTVQTKHAVYRIVSLGGTPTSITLPAYRSLRPGISQESAVNLLEPGVRLLHLRLAGDADTIALDTVQFRAAPQRLEGSTIVQSLTSVSTTPEIALTYRFPTDSFVLHLDGAVSGAPVQRRLLVTLPSRIRSEEANIEEDTRHLAIAFKPALDEVENITYGDLDTLRTRVDTGSIRWVAERNKYFVVAILAAGRDSAFQALHVRGGPRPGSDATSAYATALMPLTSNAFALRVYAGPQSWDHLRKTAADLENVNPYGGFAHGLVQPFATIVMRMIFWIRQTFDVGYGWVLVIFGVLVRIVMWPLNQNAMRSSMKLQRIQPQLAELQKKYKDNPERQREAMMKLYQEHGMSPFTPILGCLPMLLPMPILFALYFVFQNTIELRGVSFFWLPDLSLKDPYYITPLVMGITMYLMSWIGMIGMPPSPQAKMMLYVMPVMFTVLFWNFASGLNLYYAVQNIAALPQQWLLARERTGVKPPTTAPPRGKEKRE
jgi:YidC/Oxa1 family membrane protein insertase